MAHFTFPHPSDAPHARHRRPRELLFVVSAFSAGFGVLGFVMAAIGTIGPARGTTLWVGSAVLLAIGVSGAWWRVDAADRRYAYRERERRGF